MARTGAVGGTGSGDLFLAFSTGNDVPVSDEMLTLRVLPQHQMDLLFQAVAEAVEEAILNALCAAETMTGVRGRTVHSLPMRCCSEAWRSPLVDNYLEVS